MPLFGFLHVDFSLFSSTLSSIAKACFLQWYIWHLWHMSQWYHELGFIKIEVKTCVNLPRTHILPTDSTHLLQLKVQVWIVTFSISCFLWTFPLLLSVPQVWLGLRAFWQLALGLPSFTALCSLLRKPLVTKDSYYVSLYYEILDGFWYFLETRA